MTKEEGRPISSVETQRLDTWIMANPQGHGRIARLYHDAWSALGLCDDIGVARIKVDRFHPKNAWLARSPEGNVIGVLHTTVVYAPHIASLYRQIPTYAHVEALASGRSTIEAPPAVRICFSLAVPTPYRVMKGEDQKGKTIAETLIHALPWRSGVHTIAYSRVQGVAGSLWDHVRHTWHNPRLLGSAGMHEHMGGMIVAVLEGSRQEDRDGGGGNVLVAYLNTVSEREGMEYFKGRRLSGSLAVERFAGPGEAAMYVFPDVAQVVGL